MSANRFDLQVQAFKDRLRGMIARAELPEGARIEEAQLRQEAGVTVRAARQALRDLAQEGTIVRKRHVGTFVSGRRPESSFAAPPKVRSVGILSSRSQSFFVESKFGSTVLGGVQLALQAPAQVTYFVHQDNRQMSIDDLPFTETDTIKRSCQGLLAIEAYNAAQLNELARAAVPLVAIDFAPHNMAFDAVEVDHFQAGYLATRHLLALGHRRVAFVGEGPTAESTDPTWQARLNGFLRALVEAGLDATPRAIVNIRRNTNMIAEALPPVHKDLKPTGYVLCGSDMAPIAARALGGMGLSVPQDVSLSAADSALYQMDGMDISQAHVDYEVLGKYAVRVLAARLACRTMPPMRMVQGVSFNPGRTSRPA